MSAQPTQSRDSQVLAFAFESSYEDRLRFWPLDLSPVGTLDPSSAFVLTLTLPTLSLVSLYILFSILVIIIVLRPGCYP